MAITDSAFRAAGRAMMTPFTVAGAVPTAVLKVGVKPLMVAGIATMGLAMLPFALTGLAAGGLVSATVKAAPYLARGTYRAGSLAAKAFVGASDVFDDIGMHQATSKVGRAAMRNVASTGKGVVDMLIGDLKSATPYKGAAGFARKSTQVGVGTTAGLVGLGFGSPYMGGPPPPEMYSPYPGGSLFTPPGIAEDMGADGDLVFNLHDTIGSGRSL